MPLESFITQRKSVGRRDSLQQDPMRVLSSYNKHPKVVGDKDRSPKTQIQPCCSESSSKLA